MTDWNDADFRLWDLKVLNAVLRERSLTRAAETLDTTQPAVSKVLARLRAHFGDPLFVRNGQAMNPTAKALELAAPLHSLLTAADTLCSPTPPFDPRTSDRMFRVLMADTGFALMLPPLLGRIAKEGPGLTLEGVPLDSRHFEAKLESGEADLAIGAYPKAPRGLRRQHLYYDRYVSVARRDHPALRNLSKRSGFKAARHVVVVASDTGHAAQRLVQQALEAEVAPENITLRAPSFIIATLVASRTDCVATIPANLANSLAEPMGLVPIPPPFPLPQFEIAQYWHERYQRDPGHRWLRSTSHGLFAKSRR
ncbi:MAG: LysR substrate-binding domain-containing protein [Pseudomonadota bacterium]